MMNIQSVAPLRPQVSDLEYRGVRYLYPFTFKIASVPDAASYTLTLADQSGKGFELKGEQAEISLSPIPRRLRMALAILLLSEVS